MTNTERAALAGLTVEMFEELIDLLDCRVVEKGETPAEAAENVTGGNARLDAALVAAYNGE